MEGEKSQITVGEESAVEEIRLKDVSESEEGFGGPKFYPPLYVQRYNYVQEQLCKHSIKSLVDFGSAECKISRFLVQIPTLEKLALVDLDGQLLEDSKFMIQPLISDYIIGRHVELNVNIFQGSVTQLDECIVGYEGVSMVEIIEHLLPDVLESAVRMVFGQLQPKVVVMTTPNADYNQLFPGFSGFRHWDHKFEWNQSEFKNWCSDVCDQYGYFVEYGGVGEPPLGSESLGYCSQAAVFVRQKQYVPPVGIYVGNSYKLIASSIYPCKASTTLSEEEQLLLEVNYYIRQFSTWNQHCECSDNDCRLCKCDAGYQLEEFECLVPVSYLMKFRKIRCKLDLDQLRVFLQNHGYRLTEDQCYVIIQDDPDLVEEDSHSLCDINPLDLEPDNSKDIEPVCYSGEIVDDCEEPVNEKSEPVRSQKEDDKLYSVSTECWD